MTALADRLPLPAAPERDEEHPRRRLRSLPGLAPSRRPSLAHVVVLIGGLLGVLVAQLALSVTITEGAYELQGLQSQSTDLARQEQALTEQLGTLESPQYLAGQAESLGMVSGQATGFLQLSSWTFLPGADALHTTGTTATGVVPNVLLTQETVAPVVVEETAPQSYPGMLLPVEGVGDTE